MKLLVDGVQYGGFTSANAIIRLDALSNTFAFAATSDEARALPFRGGEACQVFVDGDKVLDGFIELVNVTGSSTEHTIDVQGRDKTGDLLDSSIGNLSDLRAPITLKAICEKVIAHVGATIEVVDLASPKSFSAAEDIISPEPGIAAFEFLEKYSRKRQVLLTSNEDGALVITQSSGQEVDAFVDNRVGNPAGTNNVLDYAVSYDETGRFNLYRSVSQLNPMTLVLAGSADSSEIANQSEDATDSQIRKGRQLVLVSEATTSSQGSLPRAEWEANIRKARGRVYSATVDGYRNQTGELWTVNQLVQVTDDDAGINARMLVNSVSFQIDVDRGRVTNLSFVERNAYTLELQEPVTEEVGKGLAGGVLPGLT